jgi:hypothetical protein
MIPLLELAIEAHGGLANWHKVRTVDLDFTIGGVLWQAKGLPEGLRATAPVEPSQMQVRIVPFDGEATVGYFTPRRVWVEDVNGFVVKERRDARASFTGHTLMTPWDELHELYFVGYALLNYLSSPFMLTYPGFECEEIEPHSENGETWRRLRVRFPADYPTHSREQTFYLNGQGLLKRMNYTVDIIQSSAAHYCLDHHHVGGIVVPTYRRVRGRDPAKDDPDDMFEPLAVELRITSIEVNRTDPVTR